MDILCFAAIHLVQQSQDTEKCKEKSVTAELSTSNSLMFNVSS